MNDLKYQSRQSGKDSLLGEPSLRIKSTIIREVHIKGPNFEDVQVSVIPHYKLTAANGKVRKALKRNLTDMSKG